jgi:hypothetical protein
MLTVSQARQQHVCRVCGGPINFPSAIWWEGEGAEAGRGTGATFKDGAEFAHTACLTWGEDSPFPDGRAD